MQITLHIQMFLAFHFITIVIRRRQQTGCRKLVFLIILPENAICYINMINPGNGYAIFLTKETVE